MTQDKDNAAQTLGESISKAFTGFMKFPFDPAALLEIQMKNFQAVMEAQVQLVESAQSIALHQANLAARAATETLEAMQELAAGCPMCTLSENGAEMIRKNYESSVRNWQDFAEMLGKSNQTVAETINGRVTASITELKSAAGKDAGESRKPAPKKAA